MKKTVRILAISDQEVNFLYSPSVRKRFQDVDLIISCGDLSYYYVEYIVSMLDVPLYYVRGNHGRKVEYSDRGSRSSPWGGFYLHKRSVRDVSGLILAGIDGCLRYNRSNDYQFSQTDMWFFAYRLALKLMRNRTIYGRYLDIFVTHAPIWNVHDEDDLPHQGLKAFRWLVDVFKPAMHLHGHIHVYRNDVITETQLGDTRVINVFGYRELMIDL